MNQNKKELFKQNDLLILKISGESFKENNNIFNKDFISKLANQIVILKAKVAKIGIVVGGGNIWRGMRSKEDIKIDKTNSHYIGMVATLLNALILKNAINNLIPNSCEIQSMVAGGSFLEKFSISKTTSYLNQNKIVIFCGGSGMPYFSTDTISVVRALELNATYLLMAKNNTDGIYTKDPNKFKDAKFLKEVDLNYLITNKINIIDLSALEIINESQKNFKIIVFNINNPLNLNKLSKQEIRFSIISKK